MPAKGVMMSGVHWADSDLAPPLFWVGNAAFDMHDTRR